MNTAALQLESRFSFAPNHLGYCGRDTANAKFTQCITNGCCDGIDKELPHFIVLWPYLKTLSAITKRDPLLYEVIESYWIGNDLLKEVKDEDYGLLLDQFTEQGVPQWLVEELKAKPPKKFIPTHLFQVLHVGVGRASGSVPYNLDTINACMIRWGKVVKIDETNHTATVSLQSLRQQKEKYVLTRLEETHPFNPLFVPGLKVGNTVAVHWNWVSKIITKEEEKKLKFWTEKVLASL